MYAKERVEQWKLSLEADEELKDMITRRPSQAVSTTTQPSPTVTNGRPSAADGANPAFGSDRERLDLMAEVSSNLLVAEAIVLDERSIGPITNN